jgi:hypothetical protein
MARACASGNGRLEEAMTALIQNQATLTGLQATLVQTQAAFMQNQTALLARMAESEARTAEILQRLDRIETILIDHSRLLQTLPETIREKIGFKPPGQ